MAGLAYIDDALSAIKEAHRILKRSHKAYFYLLRGAKDICATGCLEDFLSKVGGAEFTLHAFLPSWLDYWRLHKQNSPYYLDGLILEMEKTAAEFSSPYTYVGNTPIFSNPQRPFEKHAVSGIYMRQPNG